MGPEAVPHDTVGSPAGGETQLSAMKSGGDFPSGGDLPLPASSVTETPPPSHETVANEITLPPSSEAPVDETPEEPVVPTADDSLKTATSIQRHQEDKPSPTSSTGGGGWGGWAGWGGSLWSSVSTVAESAQALGQKVRALFRLPC